MSQQYITPSEAFPDKLRTAISEGPVTISGQPLQHYPNEGEPKFYGDCDFTKVDGSYYWRS